MRTSIIALALCAAALPAFAQVPTPARDASQGFVAALAKGDAISAAAYFADDGVLLPPGRPELSGKAEVQRFLGRMTNAVTNLAYVPGDVRVVNDSTVREVGTFSFKLKRQPTKSVDGKYLIIWTKVGSDWKIAADMWNRSAAGGGGQTMNRNGQGGRPGMNGNGQGAMRNDGGGTPPDDGVE